MHVVQEVDLERASPSVVRSDHYGTFSPSKEGSSAENRVEDSDMEQEEGVLTGLLLTAVLTLVVLTTLMMVIIVLYPDMSQAQTQGT